MNTDRQTSLQNHPALLISTFLGSHQAPEARHKLAQPAVFWRAGYQSTIIPSAVGAALLIPKLLPTPGMSTEPLGICELASNHAIEFPSKPARVARCQRSLPTQRSWPARSCFEASFSACAATT